MVRKVEDQMDLRKGSWTREEDDILRQCIEKHGEGKWHRIPAAAGLKRCRKSCRLRWLNYLKPDIKRGAFEDDEVDLIIKLHKLLGNRWSLIAGRLPGRTTNDVKNFWNMKQRHDIKPRRLSTREEKLQDSLKHIILKPKPRKLHAVSSCRFSGEGLIRDPIQLIKKPSMALQTSAPSLLKVDESIDWLKAFLEEEVDESIQVTKCSSFPSEGLSTVDHHLQLGNNISCRALPTAATSVDDQLDWWKSFLDQ